jgi:hypothetical protein
VQDQLQFGPMRFGDGYFELDFAGRTVDRVVISNNLPAKMLRARLSDGASGALDRTSRDPAVAARRAAADRAFASRIALIVDAASSESSAEFSTGMSGSLLFGPGPLGTLSLASAFEDELAAEAVRISSAVPRTAPMNVPLWRTFVHGEQDIPAWVYVPAPPVEAPPLVIVLHEPGFDEGWARFVPGGGQLFEIAARHRVALFAPANDPLNRDPTALTSLVSGLCAEADLPRCRVLILAPLGASELATRLVDSNPRLAAEWRSFAAPLGGRTAPLPAVGRVLGLERSFEMLLGSLGDD